MILDKIQPTRSLTELKYFNFFMYGSWSLLMPFLPLYFSDKGFTMVQIGILMSMGPMISITANPFWGYWSDRLQNIKLILIFMLFGNLIISQIYFQMNEFAFVLFFVATFFFFHTALNPISTSLILTAIEKTQFQFGTFRLWGSLGFAVIVLISSPFIEYVGVWNLGYLYGVLLVITLFFAFRLPRQIKKRASTISMKQATKVLNNKLFISFLLLSALVSIPNSMSNTFLAVYISELGGGEIYVGWSWFVAAAIEVPVFLWLDRYLKLNGKSLFFFMILSSLIYALRWILMSLATSPLHIVFIQILHAFSFAMGFYIATQICNLLIPSKYRTTGQAIYGLTWMGLGGVIGANLGGWIFDVKGPLTMYWVGACMSILSAIGFAIIWSYYRKKESLILDGK